MTFPGESAQITAAPERQRDGSTVIRSICRDCGGPLSLPCETGDGERFDFDSRDDRWQRTVLSLADLLVCDRCYARIEEERSKRNEAEAIAERIRQAGIPESFRNLSFDDMDASGVRFDPVDAARRWANAPSDSAAGLFLHGPFGTGKSRLAATAAWRRLRCYPVAWVSVAVLVARLQQSFSDSDRRDALRTLTGSGALILDDLDKVPPTETVRSQLFVAVDQRVSAGAPLFVTSNDPPGRLQQRFGGPLVSRLLGYCRVFELAGRDRRMSTKSVGEEC